MKTITKLTDDDLMFLYDNNKIKYEGVYEIVESIKLRKLVKEELQGWEVEWKDFKPECGTAALDQHGADMVMAVLKSLLKKSKT